MEKNEEVKVRKGAWTKEEDALLTKCIQHFGEGRWHLVPPRAGLKRCRKSCRMRWLNYLKPNIKRGCFDTAEVDLIRRLHKLLGNRWSLIAGRIPGRTANDVKNFWNTHMICKKQPSKTVANITTNIIKPRPRSITMSRSQSLQEKNKASSSAPSPPLLQGEVDHECSDQWWRHLLQMSENGHGTQFQDLPAVDNHIDLGGLISDFLKGFHDSENILSSLPMIDVED